MPPKPENQKKKSNSKEYMKYAGMATGLFVLLFLSYWIGSKIDEKMGNETPYFGLTIMMLSLGAYFYKLIKELS